jgi:acyl dehydratase
VHATHDLVLHRPLHSGTTFTVRAEIVSLERRTPGAYQVLRHDAYDDNGAPLWSSWTGSLYRGVDIDGPAVPSDLSEPGPVQGPPIATLPLPIGSLDALTYTECARIWNPIHTDVAVAQRAGLPAPILHGTATLAKAVTTVLAHTDTDPEQVRGLHVRFSAPAELPSTLTVHVYERSGDEVPFEVMDGSGRPILRDGRITLR